MDKIQLLQLQTRSNKVKKKRDGKGKQQRHADSHVPHAFTDITATINLGAAKHSATYRGIYKKKLEIGKEENVKSN